MVPHGIFPASLFIWVMMQNRTPARRFITAQASITLYFPYWRQVRGPTLSRSPPSPPLPTPHPVPLPNHHPPLPLPCHPGGRQFSNWLGAVPATRSAITEVLPGAVSSAAFRWNESGSFDPVPSDSEGDGLVYAGYDEEHAIVGLALKARGMGYQDVVKLLYGYSFEKQAILGISVLESRETPGLGDRIETDPGFVENFGILDVSLAPEGGALAHLIEFVKPGKKIAAWQIDGISGATITSRATADMLRESSARWVPIVHPRVAEFAYRKKGGGE